MGRPPQRYKACFGIEPDRLLVTSDFDKNDTCARRELFMELRQDGLITDDEYVATVNPMGKIPPPPPVPAYTFGSAAPRYFVNNEPTGPTNIEPCRRFRENPGREYRGSLSNLRGTMSYYQDKAMWEKGYELLSTYLVREANNEVDACLRGESYRLVIPEQIDVGDDVYVKLVDQSS